MQDKIDAVEKEFDKLVDLKRYVRKQVNSHKDKTMQDDKDKGKGKWRVNAVHEHADDICKDLLGQALSDLHLPCTDDNCNQLMAMNGVGKGGYRSQPWVCFGKGPMSLARRRCRHCGKTGFI